jgi:hypothetical protein
MSCKLWAQKTCHDAKHLYLNILYLAIKAVAPEKEALAQVYVWREDNEEKNFIPQGSLLIDKRAYCGA